MSPAFRKLALLVGGGLVLFAVVLVVNQTAQVVQLATTVHPRLGTATLWALLMAYSAAAGVPLVLFFRLPRRLIPPEREDSPEFETHLKLLGQRLATSPHLSGRDLSDRREIAGALEVLGAKADVIVREAATTVFLSTAVSQGGRLDGLLVLAAQSRMVWRIAHLYGQRPSPLELAGLYASVASTVFVAVELDELDLSEQVEPILSAALGTLGASLPGFQVVGTILTNCVLSGSANAFLTLRVGMVAKRCCGATIAKPKTDLRRAATLEATAHLGKIVADGTTRLTTAIWKASKTKVGEAMTGASDHARNMIGKFPAIFKKRQFGDQPLET